MNKTCPVPEPTTSKAYLCYVHVLSGQSKKKRSFSYTSNLTNQITSDGTGKPFLKQLLPLTLVTVSSLQCPLHLSFDSQFWHFRQTKRAGTGSVSWMSEHLVCRHTPHISHANILSPSSSLAPQLQSTVHLSSPLSIRNLLNPFFPMHLPLSIPPIEIH